MKRIMLALLVLVGLTVAAPSLALGADETLYTTTFWTTPKLVVEGADANGRILVDGAPIVAQCEPPVRALVKYIVEEGKRERAQADALLADLAAAPDLPPVQNIAVAASVVPDLDADPGAFASWALDLFKSKNWPAIAGAVVILLTWLIRRKKEWLTGRLSFLASRWGGYGLVALLAVGAVVGPGLATDAGAGTIIRGALAALAEAVFGWQVIRDAKDSVAKAKG